MIEKYHAIDAATGVKHLFKIIVDEHGWELRHDGQTIGDRFDSTVDENLRLARLNLQRIVDEMHLTSLAQI